MNTTLCKSTSPTPTPTPYLSYYRSDWTWIQPMSVVAFSHKFNKLPSFYNVYVAAYLNKTTDEWIPTSVIPYQDWPGGGLRVNMVTLNNISVSNDGDVAVYVRVDALLINM